MFNLAEFFRPLRTHPQLATMLVLIALVMSGNGLVAPILSLYATSFAASSTMIGLIITLFGVGRLIANMPGGILSQRFGRRPLLICGPAIIVIGSIGAALAQSFEALVIWRFVQGIGSGFYMTTSAAMMADVASAGERGRVMALYQAGLLLGAGIGPAIGGMLAQHFGMTAPFWAYALVCAAAVLFAFTQLDRSPAADDDNEANAPQASTESLIRRPLFLLVCIINFGVFFTRTASQWQLIPLLAHDFYGFSLDTIGFALTVMAIANFLMLPFTGNLIDRYGSSSIIIWSSLASCVALAVIAIGWGTVGFWSGIALLGVAGGLNGPAVAVYAAEIMPRKTYGPAMGLLRTFGDLGFVLGPILVGLLEDLTSFGYTGGILLNAFLVAASAMAFYLGRLFWTRTEVLSPTN
jgi:MFS transporter, DHA1 family, multidrug resistance protein